MRVLFKFLFIVACLHSDPSFGEKIDFLTHSIEGKHFVDAKGEIRGKPHAGRRSFQIELIRELRMSLGHKTFPLEVMPFKRALETVKSYDNKALFNVLRRPDREPYFSWVGPLHKGKVRFYQAANSQLKIESLEDAKKVDKICVLNRNSHDKFLTKRGFTNVHRNSSYEACFRMVMSGRATLTPITETGLPEIFKTIGVSVEKVKPSAVLFESDGYLVLSKNISKSTVSKLQNALDMVKSNGVYQELWEKYLL